VLPVRKWHIETYHGWFFLLLMHWFHFIQHSILCRVSFQFFLSLHVLCSCDTRICILWCHRWFGTLWFWDLAILGVYRHFIAQHIPRGLKCTEKTFTFLCYSPTFDETICIDTWAKCMLIWAKEIRYILAMRISGLTWILVIFSLTHTRFALIFVCELANAVKCLQPAV